MSAAALKREAGGEQLADEKFVAKGELVSNRSLASLRSNALSGRPTQRSTRLLSSTELSRNYSALMLQIKQHK